MDISVLNLSPMVVSDDEIQEPERLIERLSLLPGISFSAFLYVPLVKENKELGALYVAPGQSAHRTMFVSSGGRTSILSVSIPPSSVPSAIVDSETRKSIAVTSAVKTLGALLPGVVVGVAFAPVSVPAAAAAAAIATFFEGRTASDGLTRLLIPDLAEKAGRSPDTFFSVSNWIGLCKIGGRRGKKHIVVVGSPALYDPRGKVFFRQKDGDFSGFFVSGEVEPSLPAIRHFARESRVLFIAHHPESGRVWLVGPSGKVHEGCGHSLYGLPVISVPLQSLDYQQSVATNGDK